MDELMDAGLDYDKTKELSKHIAEAEINNKKEADRKRKEEEELRKQQENASKKQEILQNILLDKISAEVIKDSVDVNIISINDIENLDINKRNKKALLNYIESEHEIESFTIDELHKLHPMQEGRTDIYCIGLAGTGKTTMLSGLLKLGTQHGKIIQDNYAGAKGINFSNTIIQNLNRGFIPPRTLEDSFIYVPISLKDDKGISHPLNIVDVPGEIFKDISKNGEVKTFLKYINNKNKKIFFIVVDPYLHYNPTKKSLDQSLVYPNILQILKSEGIAEHIDAIYLVTNKFDYLKDNYFPFDDREEGEIALEYINTNFRALITSCLDVKEHSRYDFKVKSLPFSIGKLKWGAVLEEFDTKFSETLLEILINDSFIVKGGVGKTWK
ncbi:hypothetical protein B0A58_15870 [Flavobacterium branchiophilum NBRC 15030 = ATCC 35035]|uniref:Double-GTPase 1 domain-containing protein n=2 Tax=Flavobacterium branchiophilum TaxID=55197 RepID=A0A543G3E8_9FLAO|nr:hypothetical protein [Flavobacterium branchiophilum]OXA66864.1 hypothetical protein B0A58_15870 [Flavobacterium branchiophilum NBRC 15030 = ATCC 35035]TQM40598.1 hypothetical protein BC670_1495 [Flavobacterium branchiophilum]